MSRRERDGRDSETKRNRSGFDRDPSPKRSRRDGKPEAERALSKTDMNVGDQIDRDRRQHRRLQDAVPLEDSPAPDSKVKLAAGSNESDKKANGHHEGSKRLSDPTEIPQSRTYFQHDERGNAGQVGRHYGRRADTERQGRNSKDYRSERATNMSAVHDSHRRDEKLRDKGNDNGSWRHDGFLKMEAEPPPPARKRPAFREKKIVVDSENADKAVPEPVRPGRFGRPMSMSERKEERDRNPLHLDRSERSAGDRDAGKVGFPLRDRYGHGDGGNYRQRERFTGRQRYHPSGMPGEKWKHDLYDEANRSPTTKNEEDQIAMIESLLAS